MRPQRKRKTDNKGEGSSPSKIGRVAKRGNESKGVKSKNIKTTKKEPSLRTEGSKAGASDKSKPILSAKESPESVSKDADNKDTTGDKSFMKNTDDTTLKHQRLDFKFYDLPCDDLAKALLGQVVVTMHEGKRLTGKIVETEAYLGLVDKAAHSFKGKTDRNTAMFMQPGTAYVYNIYGMYCCLNISAQGDGCAVLIRALEPLENLELMDKLRTKGKPGNSLLKKNGKGLCNGPSKLCQALGIKKDTVNKVDMCTSSDIWLEKGEHVDDSKMIKCKRININYAEDWVDKPLRFYIHGNVFNSVRDKAAEKDQGH